MARDCKLYCTVCAALLHCVATDIRYIMGNFEAEPEYAWKNQSKLQVIKLAGL